MFMELFEVVAIWKVIPHGSWGLLGVADSGGCSSAIAPAWPFLVAHPSGV